jgi:hypothetical protein
MPSMAAYVMPPVDLIAANDVHEVRQRDSAHEARSEGARVAISVTLLAALSLSCSIAGVGSAVLVIGMLRCAGMSRAPDESLREHVQQCCRQSS